MFEIGDSVVVNGLRGIIVNWLFDEGNVWVVKVEGHGTLDCYDCELTPAK